MILAAPNRAAFKIINLIYYSKYGPDAFGKIVRISKRILTKINQLSTNELSTHKN